MGTKKNRGNEEHYNGLIEKYSYDSKNRLVKLEHLNSNNSPLAYFNYTLSPIGERVKIEEQNKTTIYNYDSLSRLLSENITKNNSTTYQANYIYDNVSNITTSIINGVTTEYSYDDNDRLLQYGGVKYTYDNNGNTLTQTLDYNTTIYSYNAKTN